MYRPSTISSLPPDVHTLDRSDQHYRPGVVWTVDGAAATVRVFCSPGDIRTYAVATASRPNEGVGAPVVARFTSTSYATIAALIPSHWGAGGPGTDEAGAVARGEFHLCVIPRSITGTPRTWWRETAPTPGSALSW